MPYSWTKTAPDASGAVLHRLHLWPYRSLPRRGFVWFIGVTAALIALPVVAMLGRAALWGILPFVALTVWAMWFALQRSYRSGTVTELLEIDRQRLHLTRRDPGRAPREWHTNSYWVRPTLRPGPVEAYLTLTDGTREVELGAFLTPEERRALHDDLTRRLASLRG